MLLVSSEASFCFVSFRCDVPSVANARQMNYSQTRSKQVRLLYISPDLNVKKELILFMDWNELC